jgi:hypothetical protein
MPREIDEYAEQIRSGTHAWDLMHSKSPEYGPTDYELTKTFDKDALIEHVTEQTESCLVFHRDSAFLQAHDVIVDNYLFDFIAQACELDEVKKTLLMKGKIKDKK